MRSRKLCRRMLVDMGKERLCESDSYYADTTQLATVVVRVDTTMRLQDFINYSNTMKHSDKNNDETLERLRRHTDEIQTQQNDGVIRSTTDEILELIDSDDEGDKKTGEQLLDREAAKARNRKAPSSGEIAKGYVERYMASKEGRKRVQQLAKTQLDI